MAIPPSLAGALQLRSIRVLPLAVAVRPVGGPGTTPVMAESMLDGSEVPRALMAETR